MATTEDGQRARHRLQRFRAFKNPQVSHVRQALVCSRGFLKGEIKGRSAPGEALPPSLIRGAKGARWGLHRPARLPAAGGPSVDPRVPHEVDGL